MTTIAFLGSWGESSEQLLARYRKQTPGNKGVWRDLIGVSDINKADVIVVLEGVQSDLKIDSSRVLYVKREPDLINPNVPCGFQHALHWKDDFCGVTWWLSKSYDELMAWDCPVKTRRASCITSNKHIARNRFVRSLFERRFLFWENSVDIDLYGRGHSRLRFGRHYRGEISNNGNCKLAGLEPYEYSLVLENSCQKNYWTEKLADAYLAWCVPIYCGCPNIGDYFDIKSLRLIDLDAPRERLSSMISQPVDSEMLQHVAESREKILNEYNLWEVVRKKIEEVF